MSNGMFTITPQNFALWGKCKQIIFMNFQRFLFLFFANMSPYGTLYVCFFQDGSKLHQKETVPVLYSSNFGGGCTRHFKPNKTYREAQQYYGVPIAVIFNRIKGRKKSLDRMGTLRSPENNCLHLPHTLWGKCKHYGVNVNRLSISPKCSWYKIV